MVFAFKLLRLTLEKADDKRTPIILMSSWKGHGLGFRMRFRLWPFHPLVPPLCLCPSPYQWGVRWQLMASCGVEDGRNGASQPALIVQAKAAVVHSPNARGSFSTEKRRLPGVTGDSVQRPNVRVLYDQQNCISGIPKHSAYPHVPPERTSRVQSASSGSLNGSSSRKHRLLSKSLPHINTLPAAACHSHVQIPWTLHSFSLKSGLLGKRAFSPQLSICPSPPKSSSQSVGAERVMPTNQSLPWTGNKLRNSKINGVVKASNGDMATFSKQKTGDLHKAANVLSSCNGTYSRGLKVDSAQPQASVHLKEISTDMFLNHKGVRHFEKIVVEDDGARGDEALWRVTKISSEGEFNINALQKPCVHARHRLQNSLSSAKVFTENSEPICPEDGDFTPMEITEKCLSTVVCTDKPQGGDCAIPLSTSVYTVTDQISAIHLTKEESAQAQVMLAGEEENPLNIQREGMLLDGDEEELPDKLEDDFSDDDGSEDCDVSSTVSMAASSNLAMFFKKGLSRQAQLKERWLYFTPQLVCELQHPQSPADEQHTVEDLAAFVLVVAVREKGEHQRPVEKSHNCSCMTEVELSLYSSNMSPGVEEPVSPNAQEDLVERPALVPSLFPHIPSTLYFSTANERVELLPAEQRKLLKWKITTVTPNVVKNTIYRSHFKATKKSHDWLGCWGHHMKSPGFKAIREFQKLNHFPGSFQIGRKDRLWRNLSKMQARFGKREFGFFPRSFILPQDIKLLRKVWEDGSSKQKWIVKPPASARGIGIQVIHKWSQMPRKRPLLVQKYLHKPYLISGNKFDLRIYVYVTSYDPLRVYIFSDGLVRFASCKYSPSMKTLSNKFMHLTNYSVNKKNSEYQSNSDDKACQGHKCLVIDVLYRRALKALWQFLGSQGVNTNLIWEKIKDMVIKTIIASDPYVNSLVKMHVRSPYSCHELFGFDIMLDENLKPWVLEVNISPSLHSNTPLDVSIKGQMIRDLLNLAGFVLPQEDDLAAPGSSASSCSSGVVREKWHLDISADEKDFCATVLDVLTPDEVRVLAESEDELSRKGDFERVFPSHASSRYLRFFEQPRYLNILLNQWEQKYWLCRSKGINLLRDLCERKVHLGSLEDSVHHWSSKSYQVHRSQLARSGVLVSQRSDAEDEDLSDHEAQSATLSLPDMSLLSTISLSPSLSSSSSLASESLPSHDDP
ncbi:hypothetical protein DNTS_033091 [Danionella cerebrum]|uniref:Tubulin tyrosine ligase-like family, member 4 n=1 Tax=Danionella cerebrum TaxID=2873325 RepID=A0A553N5T5_9TELE|nr:hypothetical protein DNTS_033091 [Danionella translucida]